MALRKITMGGGRFMLTFGMDDTGITLALSRAGERIKDFRRFWREYYAPQWFSDILKNFRTEGGPVGGWRALSPRYAAWKRRQVGPKPILQFRGAMISSFYIGNRNNIFKVTKTYVELGSKLERVAFHNRGGGRLPKRRILWTGPRRTYQPYLTTFIEEELRAAGLPNVRRA